MLLEPCGWGKVLDGRIPGGQCARAIRETTAVVAAARTPRPGTRKSNSIAVTLAVSQASRATVTALQDGLWGLQRYSRQVGPNSITLHITSAFGNSLQPMLPCMDGRLIFLLSQRPQPCSMQHLPNNT